MGNNDIKVKDLSTTSSLSTNNKLMLLTDEANNRVQNITVENLLTNIKSSNANNALSIGTDKKLYTPDLSGNIGNLTNLITTDKSSLVAAVNEVKGDTNAITGEVVSASKGWLEEGKIYQKANWYGEKIYNDVYSYNHSTNITGIDTIKPVDFTAIVNGVSTVNPTLPITGSYLNITEDGIASGFSADDYFKTNVLSTLSNTQTFKILSKIRFTSSPNGTLFGLENKLRIIYNPTSQRIELRYVTANTIWANSLLYIANSILPIQVNKDYYIGVEYDGININLIYSTDLSKTWNVASSRAEASGISGVSTLGIGKNYNGTGYLYGDLDLNSFKVYVDGNLVYQPCLLIPYNESSTGSKIVDVAFRDRVIDVYNQYGSANYYTIDETNQNATLPMGEIYGFIRQADSDKIYKDLVPCYDSTKAISVPLLGNYTAPADGYVCSPNMVLVLDPDNGYENFNLTITRNTQSMTMISCTGPTAFPFCLSVLKDDVLTVAADATVTSNVYFIPREGV